MSRGPTTRMVEGREDGGRGELNDFDPSFLFKLATTISSPRSTTTSFTSSLLPSSSFARIDPA